MRLCSYQLPKIGFQVSVKPSCRKMRRVRGSCLRTMASMSLPPRIGTKVPQPLKTFEKRSGRCQAALKAAIPPLLRPKIMRSAGSGERRRGRPSVVTSFSTAGSSSVSRNVAKRASVASNSLLRL